MVFKTGIGQDSHRFLIEKDTKPCVIGGVTFDEVPGLKANSDGDVVYHAICNAISSLTGKLILGELADELFEKGGITDSQVFVEEGLKTLGKQKIIHVALSLEGLRPRFKEKIAEMRANVARVLKIEPSQVGITATTGEGLTDFGCGEGVQCLCVMTIEGNDVRRKRAKMPSL